MPSQSDADWSATLILPAALNHLSTVPTPHAFAMTDTTTHGDTSTIIPPDVTRASPHFISRTSSHSMTSVTADLSPQTPLLGASDSDPPAFLESLQPIQPVTSSFDSRRTRSLASRRRRRRKSSLRETLLRKRLRLLRMIKCGLEAFIAVWTVFNIIRYFVSYSRYVSTQAQVASLALALSSSLSLAFFTCAVLLSTFRKSLKRRVPLRGSHIIRKSIRFVAAFLILAPAAANIVFLFIWKDSDNQEVAFTYRCHVDIDLVWSISPGQCTTPAWGVWLALAFVRFAITLAVLAAYLIVSHSYGRTLRLSTSHRLSALGPYETTIAPSAPTTSKSSATPTIKESRHSKHRPSHSTLNSNIESSTLSVLPYHSAPIARATHSGSSTSSEDDYAIRLPPGLVYNQNMEESDNFRTLISQINNETDDAISHARLSDDEDEDEDIDDYAHQSHSETSYASYPQYTSYTPSYTSQTPYSYNLPPLPPTIGYNEFGQPYPPEEPLPILNGIIRRMPTIESMGSRELGSIITSSSMYTGTNLEQKMPGSVRSTMTFDRPPTRPISRTDLVTTTSGSGVAAAAASVTTSSSRPNSFGARAELMASLGGATELGELVSAEQGKLRSNEATSLVEESANSNNNANWDQGFQATTISRTTTATASTSRSSLSYHTATSGSNYSSPPH